MGTFFLGFGLSKVYFVFIYSPRKAGKCAEGLLGFGIFLTHRLKGFRCAVESYSTIEGEDGSGCANG